MATIESLEADLDEAVTPGFRSRLIARGQARAMIWNDGALPPDAPAFSPRLTSDLNGYAYALMEAGLRLREMGGDEASARPAFEQAATALEATTARGQRSDSARSFHIIIAAAGYHLARLSARAYSLLATIAEDANYSPIEHALARLMLRDLGGLEDLLRFFRLRGEGSDAAITELLRERMETTGETEEVAERDEPSVIDAVDLALTDGFFEALGGLPCCLGARGARLGKRGDSSTENRDRGER